MASFHEPFENHFHSEIDTIAKMASHPKAPQAGTPEHAAAALMFKTWGKNTVSKAGLLDVVPFFLLNLDRTAEAPLWTNWPPMPAPIKVCRKKDDNLFYFYFFFSFHQLSPDMRAREKADIFF